MVSETQSHRMCPCMEWLAGALFSARATEKSTGWQSLLLLLTCADLLAPKFVQCPGSCMRPFMHFPARLGDSRYAAAAGTGEGTRAPGAGTRFSADGEKLHSLAAGRCGPEADQIAPLAASAAFGCTHLTCLSHSKEPVPALLDERC